MRSGFILAACALLISIHLAKGQNTQEPQSLPRPPASAPTEDISRSTSTSAVLTAEGKSGGRGGISRSSWTGDANLKFPLIINPSGISVFGSVGFSYTGESYHFTGRPNIAGSDAPWNQVNIGTISTGVFTKLNDRWGVFSGFSVTSAAASGADLGQSFTYGVCWARTTKCRKTCRLESALSLSPGLAATCWRCQSPSSPGRCRSMITAGAYSAEGGQRVVAQAAAHPAWPSACRINPSNPSRWQRGFPSLGAVNDFRLSSQASVSNGIVRDDFSQLIFNLNDQPDSHLSFNGFIGVDLPGNLRVIRSTGGQVYNENTGIAPVFGASVTWRF